MTRIRDQVLSAAMPRAPQASTTSTNTSQNSFAPMSPTSSPVDGFVAGQISHTETKVVKNDDVNDETQGAEKIEIVDEASEESEQESEESKDGVASEEDDVGLDRTILDHIKELTDRVDKILAEEERCWYELENPRCRMRRPEFQLKVRIDVIQSIKSYQIKELVEVLKEVSTHYSDAIDQIVELKKEVTDLKTEVEADTDVDTEPESDDDTQVKTDDESDVDMDKSNIEDEVQSVADDIDTMSLTA